jgi:hypothetical protein
MNQALALAMKYGDGFVIKLESKTIGTVIQYILYDRTAETLIFTKKLLIIAIKLDMRLGLRFKGLIM